MTNSSPPKVNPLSTAAAGRSESPDVPVNAAQQEADATEISMVIESLKLQADADRREYVMKRMEENRIKVAEITRNRHQLSIERTNQMNMNGNKFDNLLSRRQQEAIDMQKRGEIRFGGSSSSQEDDPVIPLGPGIVLNSSVRPIILPKVEKLPRHVTSVFIDRNQRRIYDDHNGFSDEEEEEREFAGPEDNIIRMTVEEVGASDTVFDLLAKRLSREPCEVKARYEALVSRKNATESSKPGETDSAMNALLDKRLEEAQAPFDYLFCRQCLIFDCKFHGHGQELVYPVEKGTWDATEEETVPCGENCYFHFQVKENEGTSEKKVTDFNSWRTLEKDLFKKGLEIFGRNSCLIARNLLGGLKTCAEVHHVLEDYKPS